ncbi:MAG: hypothetical protein AAGF28_03315 [Pseudomonadota bacterium]
MQFIQSFSSLGYSAIVLVLTTLFVAAGLFNLFKMHKRHLVFKVAFAAVILVGFVFATNFLADQRQILYDGIRSEGGLKRTFPEN